MKNLFIFLSLLLLPTFAFADHCPDLLHCRFPFPWKEWALICGICWGGCWWFCRRCKCTCTGGNCDLTLVLTAIADLKTEVLAVKADLAAAKGDVLGVKTDVTGVKTDIAAVKTDVINVQTDVAGVKADLLNVKNDVLGVKADVAAVLAAVDDVNRTIYLAEHEL